MKYSTPIVDVHLNNHCNLACVGCNHFSDLTNKDTPQISDENLFETLNLVSQKIECTTQLSLLGGEIFIFFSVIGVTEELEFIT